MFSVLTYFKNNLDITLSPKYSCIISTPIKLNYGRRRFYPVIYKSTILRGARGVVI